MILQFHGEQGARPSALEVRDAPALGSHYLNGSDSSTDCSLWLLALLSGLLAPPSETHFCDGENWPLRGCGAFSTCFLPFRKFGTQGFFHSELSVLQLP